MHSPRRGDSRLRRVASYPLCAEIVSELLLNNFHNVSNVKAYSSNSVCNGIHDVQCYAG